MAGMSPCSGMTRRGSSAPAPTPTARSARVEIVVDSTTALITVTISQLAVTITLPVGGAQIIGGSEVAVAGTAVPFLGGAPLDSVVVIANNQRLRATGLANWSTPWTAPTVSATTPLQIIARAFAGADSAQTLVDVSIEPAAR